MDSPSPTDFKDVLFGAKAIASVVYSTRKPSKKQVKAIHYALARGNLPANKMGAQWISSRRALSEAFRVSPVKG